MSTKERLATLLEANNAPAKMIEDARNGLYDDFESPLPSPTMHLVADLQEAGLHFLAEHAMNGDFDSTKEEAEAWFEREGKDVFK